MPALGEGGKIEQDPGNEVSENISVSRKRQPITVAMVNHFWNAFKEKRKETGKDRELNVLNQPYTLKDELIQLQLSNPIQGDILSDFKDELLLFLRSQLQNDYLSLEVQYLKQDEKKMIYTSKEKYDYLTQKNPHLKSLKDHLGLDNEY